jgi:phospholipid transport system substrate-binding protein
MRKFATVFALCLSLSLSHALAEGSDDAAAFLKQRQAGVEKLIRQTPENKEVPGDALSKAISDLLDYDELSKRALSDHWAGRSEAERTEFVSLLRQLVERNYKNNVRGTLGYDIQYTGNETKSDGVLVKTEAKSKTNKRRPAVGIDYLMYQANGQWRVVDITTDGVSMVRNYRSQFNRIIRKDGWGELIRRMKDRLANAGDF